MRAFFICFFLFIASPVFSQNLDSLKLQVQRVPESDRFEAILNYMRHLLGTDVKASFSVSLYALEYAELTGDSLLITKALYAQGFLLRRMENDSQSVIVLKSAYGIAKRNQFSIELSKILNLLAISHTYSANFDEALKIYFEALTLNEKIGNLEDISISYNNIGIVYFKLRNSQEALRYYKKSLEAKQKANSTFDLDRLYVNMALCFNQIQDYEAADKSIKEALALCKDNCADELLMDAELALGISLFERGKIEDSKIHFEKSLDLARKSSNRRFEIENLLKLANVFWAATDTGRALTFLSEAERIANSGNFQQPLMEVYKMFAIIYERMDDFKNSSFYSKRYSDLRDSVLSEELINNLADVQAKYAERENLSTIADNQKVIRAQRNLNYAIAFIVVMAFAFIYLIMRNSRTIRSLNTRLAQEVQQKTMELVKSNHSLKQVNEELDNLVYKTSHDIRGPLATLKGVCNIALMDVKDDTALAFLKRLDSTSSQLNLVLDKFSRVNEIYNTVIRPQRLNIQALIEEMVSIQQKTPRQKRIAIIQEIQTIEDFQTSPSLFYYALNSLIDNAFRYYNESPRVDSFVKISVERKRDDVVIRIIDNGVGIPVNIDSDSLFHMFTRGSERSLTGGMGLFIASTAVRKLQGEIKFQRSTDFILTEFVMILPLKMDFNRIEHPKERGKILPATTELIATLDSRFEK